MAPKRTFTGSSLVPTWQIEGEIQRVARKAVGLSLRAAAKSTSKQLQAIGRLVAGGHDNERLTELHQKVGVAAQNRILNAYARNVTAKKLGPSYREGDRYAGGALRRALASPDFFRATPRGLDFINISLLDQEAYHWHRLNFGALPRGQGSTRSYEVRWGGLVAIAIGFNEGPSHEFGMPPGFWIAQEGKAGPRSRHVTTGNTFYPFSRVGSVPGTGVKGSLVRQRAVPVTQGIVARHFLEAGLETIATTLPVAYQEYYRTVFEEAERGIGPGVRIRALARPRDQKVTVYVSE